MKKIYIFLSLIVSVFLLSPLFVLARDSYQITDWYIKSLDTKIEVYEDSSLLITEKIIADCGNLSNKHGIFRVLPTQIKTDDGIFKTPIELISITDFDNNPCNFQKIVDNSGHTITWKIGDKDVTVRGINDYKIVYKVKNVIRFQNDDFDEFYWNLLGTFWDLEIDQFAAKISFPEGITQNNTIIDYYTGYSGSKSKDLATYEWTYPNVLTFSSVKGLYSQQGITLSVAFPKNIFTPYKMSFLDKWGYYFEYFSFLIPIMVFIICFLIWKKHGKDPKMRRPIPPEFGIPDKITPIQMGMIISSGRWNNNLITATIIDLAVRKFIIIEEIEKKILFIKTREYILKKTDEFDLDKLTEPEKMLVEKIFKGASTATLASLRNDFHKDIKDIKEASVNEAANNRWIVKEASTLSTCFVTAGILMSIFIFYIVEIISFSLFISILISGIILIIFGAIMPKRTPEGVELFFRISGFKLYMKKAEKYRQQFYEKENIFDKFLPYAIAFGIASLWIKKMEQIYGKEYFATYHPIWFTGNNVQNFSTKSFISQLNSITSSISANTGGASGAGGMGGAGGGGGGGGGGGW